MEYLMHDILDYITKYRLVLTDEMKEDLAILIMNIKQKAFKDGEIMQRDFPRTEGS
jgi:hypothetical protein